MLTVYVTNYNYGSYIEEALNSLFRQTFQDFDILIIDDGSTDNSKEIIEKYSSHEKVKVIFQQNSGLNVSNNVALRVSKSKYIMRLDADDYLVDNALELMINKLEADNGLGLVFPDYYIVSGKGEILHKEQRHKFSKEVSMLDQPAHGACTMIRREFLLNLGGYDESFTCQDGYDLWIKFISNHKVDNINEPLFYYRQHGNNLTRNEERILFTRAQIKQTYLDKSRAVIPHSMVVIPLRNEGGNPLFYRKIGDATLLEIRINEALKAKQVTKVVITSEDPHVEEIIRGKYVNNERVVFLPRKSESARYNVDLTDTLNSLLQKEVISKANIDIIIVTPVEFPFITGLNIDDAINTMELFKADSIVAVRPENNVFFQHHGNGMHPILNQDKFNKLERDLLYRNTGGILGTRVTTFKNKNRFLGDRVGHIVLTQKEAIILRSEFDFRIAEFLTESNV